MEEPHPPGPRPPDSMEVGFDVGQEGQFSRHTSKSSASSASPEPASSLVDIVDSSNAALEVILRRLEGKLDLLQQDSRTSMGSLKVQAKQTLGHMTVVRGILEQTSDTFDASSLKASPSAVQTRTVSIMASHQPRQRQMSIWSNASGVMNTQSSLLKSGPVGAVSPGSKPGTGARKTLMSRPAANVPSIGLQATPSEYLPDRIQEEDSILEADTSSEVLAIDSTIKEPEDDDFPSIPALFRSERSSDTSSRRVSKEDPEPRTGRQNSEGERRPSKEGAEPRRTSKNRQDKTPTKKSSIASKTRSHGNIAKFGSTPSVSMAFEDSGLSTHHLDTMEPGGAARRYCNVFPPESAVCLAWTTIIVLNTILAATIIPLILVYFDRQTTDGALDNLLLYIDICWLLDIGMNFRTGFYSNGELNCDCCSIAQHYAQGWLLPDIISAWPLALTGQGRTAYMVCCLVKFPRLMQLRARFNNLQSGHLRAPLSSAILPAFIIAVSTVATHLMACLWRLTLRAHGSSSDFGDDVFKRYVNDVYFVTTTLTSVGYGDIAPQPGNSISQVYAILMMLLGSAVFGACISGCTYVFQMLLKNETASRTAELTRFMNRRSVPRGIQKRVLDNLRQHLLYAEATTMTPELLVNLSPAMQRELCLSVLSTSVLRFPLFKNAQRSFVAELAQAYSWEQVLPGDLITDHGQAVQDVVFVMEGHLQAELDDNGLIDVHFSALNPDRAADDEDQEDLDQGESHGSDEDENMPVSCMKTISTGAWFGEASLFDGERVYSAIITATTRCELSLLPAGEYTRIVQKYPRLLKKHNSIKKAIVDGRIALDSFRYEETERTATAAASFRNRFKKFLARSVTTLSLPRSLSNLSSVTPTSPS